MLTFTLLLISSGLLGWSAEPRVKRYLSERRMRPQLAALAADRARMDAEKGAAAQGRLPKPTPGSLGATPRHYRALSILDVRLPYTVERGLVHALRQRAKLVKNERDEMVRDEALRLLDHFSRAVDEFAPLHENAGPDARDALEATMTEALRRTHEALTSILEQRALSPDGFNTAVRFLEQRYAPQENAFAAMLAPIEDAPAPALPAPPIPAVTAAQAKEAKLAAARERTNARRRDGRIARAKAFEVETLDFARMMKAR